MNRRHLVALAVCLISLSLLPPAARAQNGIPVALKTANAVDAASVKPSVHAWFADLASKDNEVQKKARAALIDAASGSGMVYAGVLGQAVSDEATAMLGGDVPLRAKINIGVAVAGVAEGAKSAKLEAAAAALLDDKSEAVKLWGIKTARHILPELQKLGSHQKMVDRVLKEAKENPTGPMTDEAYQALLALGTPQSVKPLLDLVGFRIDAYQKEGVPEDPQYDNLPLVQLVQRSAWQALTPVQQQQVMQAVVNLLSFAAQRGDDPAARAVRDQLQMLINNVAGALLQPFDAMGDQNMVMIARTVAGGTSGTSHPASLYQVTRPLIEGILAMPAFKTTLKQPPVLPPMQAVVGP